MTGRADAIAGRLVQLGFSQYEARTYVGLLVCADAATGYGVANETGVPQPKVYETLRKLVERGAAIQVGERPARYAATPPDELLGALEREFQARLVAARQGLESLPHLGLADPVLPVSGLSRFEAAAARAEAAIARAHTRVYLHGRSEELRPLAPAVAAASDRRVEFVIVHFGPLPFARPRGQVVRHESTEGTLYPARKSRHLAVVVDSEWSLWALARDGQRWEGMHGDGPLLAGLIKTYIRHDLFVQRMYADAPELFEERYGPGLLRLGLAPAEPADEAAAAEDAG
jgi:HTH-type transcriptional regulator, sugar sensing transcriptional regulator